MNLFSNKHILKHNKTNTKNLQFNQSNENSNSKQETGNNNQSDYNSIISILQKTTFKNLKEINIIKSYLSTLHGLNQFLIKEMNNEKECINYSLNMISSYIKMKNFFKSSFLMKFNEKNENFYVILKGKVEVISISHELVNMSKDEYKKYLIKLIEMEEYEAYKVCLALNNKIFKINKKEMKYITNPKLLYLKMDSILDSKDKEKEMNSKDFLLETKKKSSLFLQNNERNEKREDSIKIDNIYKSTSSLLGLNFNRKNSIKQRCSLLNNFNSAEKNRIYKENMNMYLINENNLLSGYGYNDVSKKGKSVEKQKNKSVVYNKNLQINENIEKDNKYEENINNNHEEINNNIESRALGIKKSILKNNHFNIDDYISNINPEISELADNTTDIKYQLYIIKYSKLNTLSSGDIIEQSGDLSESKPKQNFICICTENCEIGLINKKILLKCKEKSEKIISQNTISLITKNIILKDFSKERFKKEIYEFFKLRKIYKNEVIQNGQTERISFDERKDVKLNEENERKVYFVKKGSFSLRLTGTLIVMRNILSYIKEILKLLKSISNTNKEELNSENIDINPLERKKFDEMFFSLISKINDNDSKDKQSKSYSNSRLTKYKVLKNRLISFLIKSEIDSFNRKKLYLNKNSIENLGFDKENEYIVNKKYLFEIKIYEDEGIFGLLDFIKLSLNEEMINKLVQIKEKYSINFFDSHFSNEDFQNKLFFDGKSSDYILNKYYLFDVVCLSNNSEVFEIDFKDFHYFIDEYGSLFDSYIENNVLSLENISSRLEKYISNQFSKENSHFLKRFIYNKVIFNHSDQSYQRFKTSLSKQENKFDEKLKNLCCFNNEYIEKSQKIEKCNKKPNKEKSVANKNQQKEIENNNSNKLINNNSITITVTSNKKDETSNKNNISNLNTIEMTNFISDKSKKSQSILKNKEIIQIFNTKSKEKYVSTLNNTYSNSYYSICNMSSPIAKPLFNEKNGKTIKTPLCLRKNHAFYSKNGDFNEFDLSNVVVNKTINDNFIRKKDFYGVSRIGCIGMSKYEKSFYNKEFIKDDFQKYMNFYKKFNKK